MFYTEASELCPIENQIVFIGMGSYLNCIPNHPGVYFFYAENNALLYIGKSKHLRKRIQSHISTANTDDKEARLLSQTKKITWRETAGELGALLLEAKLVKTLMPIFNRRLRRNKALFSLYCELIKGYYHLQTVPVELSSYALENLYGLFKNKRSALEHLQELIKTYQLCPKLCGLDSSKQHCFQYQLKRCQGACMEEESSLLYNKKVLSAISPLAIQHWPFKGRIAISEKHGELAEWHIIDRWIYHSSIPELSQANNLVLENAKFDIDYYRIILYWLSNQGNTSYIEL